MAVIISHRIRRKEFKRGIISGDDLQTILNSFRKGISVSIKGRNLPKASKLIKIYATAVAGARRIVYLVDMASSDGFLLFYRSKNDRIGKNISIQNPEFRKKLNLYLELLSLDIEAGAIDVYDDF